MRSKIELMTTAGGAAVTYTPTLLPTGDLDCDGCGLNARHSREGAQRHAETCRAQA